MKMNYIENPLYMMISLRGGDLSA